MTRTRARGWLGAALTGLAIVVPLACAADDSGAGDQSESRSSTDTSSAAPTGDIVVEATGHTLHAECLPGPGPTVVFLHGAGGTGSDWSGTIAHLDGFATCTYDRFNVGVSGKDTQRHSPAETAEDLEGILQSTGMSPPYVLVGHSWGGLLALLEAGRHPEQVAGLVLVDSMLPLETELDPPGLVEEVRTEVNAFEPGLDAYDGYDAAREVEDRLPDVPMTFIYANKYPDELPWPAVDYEARLNAWVATWRQGRLVTCDCSHSVPREAPDLIAEQVRAVADAT